MNNSKYNEIYDEYKGYGRHVDEKIIDTVTHALKDELGYLLDAQAHMESITSDHRFYERGVKNLHTEANLVHDLGAFISEYYLRTNCMIANASSEASKGFLR